MKEVTIIGAGVAGLTTAVALQNAGNKVRVIADAAGAASTSGAAGAVWYPYHVEPWDRVNEWACQTRNWLCKLHRDTPEAGVIAIKPMFIAADDANTPSWAGALPSAEPPRFIPLAETPDPLRLYAQSRERPTKGTWRFDAPVIAPGKHLDWLASQLRIPVEFLKAPLGQEGLSEIPGVIVNCTGHRATSLFDDPELEPKFGQMIEVRAATLPGDFVLADDRHETDLFYVIPRGETAVVGGYNAKQEPNEHDESASNPGAPSPREDVSAAILGRCQAAGIAINPEDVMAHCAGWRPARKQVRVERDGVGRIVHNYGHGGAGFTLAWGCARSVEMIVASM